MHNFFVHHYISAQIHCISSSLFFVTPQCFHYIPDYGKIYTLLFCRYSKPVADPDQAFGSGSQLGGRQK